ncbi:hypothetical protein SD70_09085 [Gordoniibacillus kamchatkensis]|uniref:Uncharacterized protein n=1 Tax=Gordoniibacillus kamchatkensis TaxID=1590651 RepID=A0ABR5AJF2_9BACL|nr:hypothetical protein [Paenibacillus sp. VKM B-2647]KIL41171.1 hypothetical protein SD70_09085 [Paenibacillus sp. VKM B-2647]
MPTLFVPTLPQLADDIIRKLTPYSVPQEQWKLTAAAHSETLLWLRLEQRGEGPQVLLGIPSAIADMILEGLGENAIREAWNEPEARLLDIEQLSQSLPAGDRKLLIAPVPSAHFGDIRVTVLY